MYQPEAYFAALLFMVISMICWGSWANTMKLTPGYAFQLFYWDYLVGMLLGTLLWGFTLGSNGHSGLPFLSDIQHTDQSHILYALAGGIVFNVANLLLVAAIDIAGMAVAFPIGIGLALVVGVLLNYIQKPTGNPLLLFGGVAVVIVAIVLVALAYRRREKTSKSGGTKGIPISIACGILMGSFYPLVTRATKEPDGLGPYGVGFIFAIGAVLCAIPLNYFFMRKPLTGTPPVSWAGFFQAKPSWHFWGIVGGMIWCTGTIFNFVASHAQIVGPAISYAIGQGATMVSAIWGVFIWREFANAPASARRLIPWMFVFFLLGLGAIAIAPIVG